MIWALRRCVAAPSLALLLLLPVIAADPYDNGVIAAGRLIGAGPLLEGLSWWRYLLHVVSLPCWIVAMVLLAGRAGVRWAQTQLATVAAALIAVAVVGATLTRELLPLSLERIMRGDVLLYVDANQAGPPLVPNQATWLGMAEGFRGGPGPPRPAHGQTARLFVH